MIGQTRWKLRRAELSQFNQYLDIMVNTVPSVDEAAFGTPDAVITIMRNYWANASRSQRLAPGREHGAHTRQAGVATNTIVIEYH